MKKSTLIILFVITRVFYGQEIIIKGKVTDSLNTPVVFANVVGQASGTKKIPPVFTITDEKGKYRLSLLKKYSYKISVMSMGYDTYSFRIDSLSSSLEKDIILKASENQLDEIVITADLPVKVTQDSIVYKTDRFKTGEERKLKDVLKKLPGVEVEKNGQVKVMGKKVSSVLVDGKEFFGGGTKLAVENIPADAVDKVTAIKNYNSIGFMRGLTDEQKMVINIKLKEGKKRFVFGDISAGVGVAKKYLGKTNLFYYSPKTNFSFIGNINNTDGAPITMQDYLRFEGSVFDFEKIRSSFKNFKIISNLFTSEDYLNKKDIFGAFMWQQDIGTQHELSMYAISGHNKTDYYQQETNLYLQNNLLEQRNTDENKRGISGIAKTHYRYKPNIFNYFDITFSGNLENTNYNKNLQSIINQKNTFVLYHENFTDREFDNNIAWHRKINKKHTIRLLSNFSYVKKSPNENWQTDKQILNTILPLKNAKKYTIQQNFSSRKYFWNSEIKHYWLFNIKQHIYTSFGSSLLWKDFFTNTFQITENNTENNFSSAGFGNNSKMKLFDYYGGLQYKIKLGKFMLLAGVFAHKYYWNISQDNNYTSSKWKLLPEISIKNNSKFSKEISFTYRLKSSIPGSINFLSRYYLTSFSSVDKGNPYDLREELMHDFTFRYRKYNILSGKLYYVSIAYKRKISSLKDKIRREGINTYSTSVMSYIPENDLRISLAFRTNIKKIYIELSPFLLYKDYNQNLQDKWRSVTLTAQAYDIRIGSYFKKFPNFKAGIRLNYTTTSFIGKSQTSRDVMPYVELEYDFLKSFILKTNYKYTHNIDYLNNKNSYQDASFSLFYKKDNNPWGFELKIDNIFNTQYERLDYFSDYVISTTNTYKQARLIMFKVSYKL